MRREGEKARRREGETRPFVEARLRFSPTLDRRPSGDFLAQGKLISDEPDHPHGQWTVAVKPLLPEGDDMPSELDAYVAFLAHDAPHDALKVGETVELFHGFDPIGSVLILVESDQP